MTHRIVLLRHGESTWNKENRFTGWTDVGLTDTGISEAHRAAALLRDAGYDFDVLHTSLLRRAIMTAQIVLDDLDRCWLPVRRSWRLNERHYGALQGLDKKQTAARYGDDQVFVWRRSYDVPPPPLAGDDERHPRRDVRYRHLPSEVLPATECLADVVVRVLPYWHDTIVPEMQAGRRVLIAAHGNSLRAMVKHFDRIPDADIPELNIPTGIPLVYELDDDMRPLRHHYLGDPDEVRRAAEAVANQASRG